ncbi:MAG: thiol:disulfide interchange protein DsbA/DsbL [Gallionella sp.]|nr:thiol:disulfide interchange protein DsbA/DsbL [Gallionella sp.]
MRNLIKNLFVAAILFIGGAAVAAVEPGKDYKLLNPPQPTNTKKIEVLEFFFYGCSHCYHLHPQLSAWEKNMPKDVELVYVPVIFRDSWEPMARTFYALESLGQQHQLHDALYKAWNVDNDVLGDEAKVLDFLAPRGVDRAKFSAAYNSFSMQSKITRAKQMIRSYGITGTPTLIVNGKYLITGVQPAEYIRILNEVIDMVRKERSPASAKGKAKQ